MKYKLLLFIKKITVSKELHVSAHESHHQAYKCGTSKTKKVLRLTCTAFVSLMMALMSRNM